MREEDVLKAFDAIQDEYLLAANPRKQILRKRIKKMVSVAAIMVLFIISSLNIADRMDVGRMGCNSILGTVVNGKYYYYKQHKGVFSYDSISGETRKEISTFVMDSYIVDEYGIYYDYKTSLYVKEHLTGNVRKIFSAGRLNATHINYEFIDDNEDILITIYNMRSERIYQRVINGLTGEDISCYYTDIIYDPISYEDSSTLYDKEDNEEDNSEISSLLSELEIADYGNFLEKNNIFLDRETLSDIGIVCGMIGDNIIYKPKNAKDDTFYICNIATKDKWQFNFDADVDVYSILVNDDIIYSCAPWLDNQYVWKVVYDKDGVTPLGAKLIDEIK